MVSKVVDARICSVPNELRLGVDTNFLIDVASPRSSPEVTADSSSFLKLCLLNHVKLFRSHMVDIELSYTIEKIEYQLQKGPGRGTIKEYRSDVANRAKLAIAMRSFHDQINSFTSRIILTFDNEIMDRIVFRSSHCALDAMDVAVIESYLCFGLKHILTNDYDFATYSSDVIVVTTNPRLVADATLAGQLATSY